MKKFYLLLLCFSLSSSLEAQKTVTTVVTASGTFSQDAGTQSLGSAKSIKYSFLVGNLIHPKFVIQDLYSLFKVNPLYKDSLGQAFFSFNSNNDVDQTTLANKLNSLNYNLISFDKKYVKDVVDSSDFENEIKKN